MLLIIAVQAMCAFQAAQAAHPAWYLPPVNVVECSTCPRDYPYPSCAPNTDPQQNCFRCNDDNKCCLYRVPCPSPLPTPPHPPPTPRSGECSTCPRDYPYPSCANCGSICCGDARCGCDDNRCCLHCVQCPSPLPTPPHPHPTPPSPFPPTPAPGVKLWHFVRQYAPFTNLTSLCTLSPQCTSTLKDADTSTTIFAPTDKAFAALPEATRTALFKPGNKEARIHFLLRHFISGDILSSALKPAQDLETLDGTKVHVTRSSTSGGDVIQVEGIAVTRKDMVAVNGVIDSIDSCIPPSAPTPPTPDVPTPPPAPTPPAPAPSDLYVCHTENATCIPSPTGGASKEVCEQVCKRA